MTIVVKVGGAAGNATAPLLDELAERHDVVLVHGGSEEIDRLGDRLGVPAERYTSPSGVVSRRSDPAHLEAVVLALAGKVQSELVAALVGRGARAVGLSGVDGPLLLARKKSGARAVVGDRVVRLPDDRSGTIERVDADLLETLLRAGRTPVVGPPAISPEGEILNVDADAVAAAVAGALRATDLVFLTNVPGLLRRVGEADSLIALARASEIDALLPVAQGRMRKKILAARDALRAGVTRVVIAPSRVDRPVERALAGEGTVIA